MPGKPSLRTIAPGILAVAFGITLAAVCVVVVHDDLVALPVTLTGRPHDGTGILKHRHQVGDNDGLREQVFGGAEQIGALPLPTACLLIVVAAMTCSDG